MLYIPFDQVNFDIHQVDMSRIYYYHSYNYIDLVYIVYIVVDLVYYYRYQINIVHMKFDLIKLELDHRDIRNIELNQSDYYMYHYYMINMTLDHYLLNMYL
jgi:hypothetical protein